MKRKQRKLNQKSGQGLVEYALILGLIAVVTAAVIINLGKTASSKLDAANTALASS